MAALALATHGVAQAEREPAPPPETEITSGPEGVVYDGQVEFTYSSDTGVRYECRLNGSPWVGCPDGEARMRVPDGENTIEVRAFDASGAPDPTPASITFIADGAGDPDRDGTRNRLDRCRDVPGPFAADGCPVGDPPACRNPIHGTEGPDSLTGHGVYSERIDGLGGTDFLSGLGGRDCLIGGNGASEQWGGLGNDLLRGENASDLLAGGGGHDRLLGNGDEDILVGGPGRDTLLAGRGVDLLRARDGRRDEVSCGSGRDLVKADPKDRLSACDRARRGTGRD